MLGSGDRDAGPGLSGNLEVAHPRGGGLGGHGARTQSEAVLVEPSSYRRDLALALGLGTGDPPLDLRDIVLSGKTIRGCLEGDAVPRRFIPELLDMYAAGRLPLDRLVRVYPHTEINSALADHRAGHIIKPVLAW